MAFVSLVSLLNSRQSLREKSQEPVSVRLSRLHYHVPVHSVIPVRDALSFLVAFVSDFGFQISDGTISREIRAVDAGLVHNLRDASMDVEHQ